MSVNPKEMFDTLAMRWFDKPYEEVERREFTQQFIHDYQERHKDETKEAFEDWLGR